MSKATELSAVLAALGEYLRRPKTVFDIKDRTRALLLFAVLAYVLFRLVEKFWP